MSVGHLNLITVLVKNQYTHYNFKFSTVCDLSHCTKFEIKYCNNKNVNSTELYSFFRNQTEKERNTYLKEKTFPSYYLF